MECREFHILFAVNRDSLDSSWIIDLQSKLFIIYSVVKKRRQWLRTRVHFDVANFVIKHVTTRKCLRNHFTIEGICSESRDLIARSQRHFVTIYEQNSHDFEAEARKKIKIYRQLFLKDVQEMETFYNEFS